ncbi:ABC transporter substrate-binding protein [Brevundimonas sp. P7753]|uniref:ABC transporter substrate-binding protein n=1 Tax=Brevundimonas sp. P7753 TaxID=2726982 RepID=UPI0015BFD24E|nr:ABC transporter substrate-binding protein [Brevundimonas sp. P7753]NWE53285.1 ABC transporter substrate-binding protein [Brevundimonas sp. P7753]
MIRLSLLFLLIGLGVGCSPPPPPADVLRVGVPALPASWGDPYRAEGGPPAHTWSALFDGLTRLDEVGEVQPALAERWTSLDGKTWVFTLRDGVRFSNGAPVNASAAAATFRWLISPAGRTTIIGARMRDIAAVAAPDARTLILTLQSPDPVLPRRLTSTMIVEPEAWLRLGPAGFAKAPIGSGPFRLERFDERGRRAIMTANPQSWRAPRVAGLEVIELTDEAVRNQALISQHIDLGRVGLDELGLLEARGLSVVTPPSMQVMAIALVTEGRATPLDDVRVRQALNHAVDKGAISQMLLAGRGAPSGQPASRVTAGYDPSIAPYDYDPERSIALLKAAGYGDGFDLAIEGVIGALPADAAIYQAVASYLIAIGVRAEFRPAPYATMVSRNQTGRWDGIDAFANPLTAAPYNDLRKPLETYSCLKPKPFFCDPALTEALIASSSIMDVGQRTLALQRLSRAYHDAAASIYLAEQIDVFGHTPRVKNLVIANRVPVYELIELKNDGPRTP